MKSRLIRIRIEDYNEINKIYLKNNRKVPKVAIVNIMVNQYKTINKKTPKLVINYWPLSTRKVKIY